MSASESVGGTYRAEQGLLAALAKPRKQTEKIELGGQSLKFSMTEEDENGRRIPIDLSQFRIEKRQDKQRKRDEVVGETLALHHKEMRLGYTAPMDGFEKLKVKSEERRKRHDEAAKRFDTRLKEVSDELEQRVIASGVAVQELLGEVDGAISACFEELRDDVLREQPSHSYVLQQWDKIAEQCTRRTAAIVLFGEDLEGLEQERTRQVGNALRQLADEMVAIAYKLPPEIERLVEVEVHDLNLVLIGNRRAHADLVTRLSRKDVTVGVESRSAWQLREAAWRRLRHERALRVFGETIASRRFVNPLRRRELFQALREGQRARQTERESLLVDLGATATEGLSSSRCSEIAQQFVALRDRDAEATEQSFGALREALEESRADAQSLREELRAELHTYGALAAEGGLERFAAALRATLADEALDEFWRMAGSLKPELKHMVELVESPRIVYMEELCELRSKVDLLVQCLPLAEELEEQGKGGERAALVSTLEQVRKAAKSDLPGLLPVLQAQASSLASVSGLPPLQAEALSTAAANIGAVLDEYASTQRQYEATMKKQKAGKQTDFAASLGLDTTQINMAGVRQAQRTLAMLVHATSLGGETKQLLCDLQERTRFQDRANRVVDQVIVDTCTAPLAARAAEGEALLNRVGEALTAQARSLHGGAMAMCVFFKEVAVLGEDHVARELKLDEESMDQMWQLRDGQEPKGHRERLGRDPSDTDDFEPVKPGLWEIFNQSVHELREAPDQKTLQVLLESARAQLDGIEEEYRTYHKDSVSAAYNHPRAVAHEMRRYLRALCRQFRMVPNVLIMDAGAEQGIADEPEAEEVVGRVGILDGFEEEALQEEEELRMQREAELEKKRQKARAGNQGEAGDGAEDTAAADEDADGADATGETGGAQGEDEAGNTDQARDADATTEEQGASADEDEGGEAAGEEGGGASDDEQAPEDEGAAVPTQDDQEMQDEQEEQPVVDPWEAPGLVLLETKMRLQYGVVCDADKLAQQLLATDDTDADGSDDGEGSVAEAKVEGAADQEQPESAEPDTNPGAEAQEASGELAEEQQPPTAPVVPPVPTDPDGEPCIEEVALPHKQATDILAGLRWQVLTVRDSESAGRADWAESQCNDRQAALSDELEERLRLHWPRKGRIEVQSFQPREQELLAHEQRLARHIRATRIRHRERGASLEQALKQARTAVEKHVLRIDTLQAQLALQPNLAALQGMEGRAKAATAQFHQECKRWQSKLGVLASDEPRRVVHAHEELVRSCLQATFRLGGDYNPAECVLVEEALKGEVDTLRSDAVKREDLCAQLAEEQSNAAARYERFAARYKRCLKELCMRDGLGQKFGAPRRNAQERLRTAVSRSDMAAKRIDEAIAELQKLVDIAADAEASAQLREKVERAKGRRGRKARAFLSLRVRRVMLLLRTYIYRRAAFLSFLKMQTADGSGAAGAAAADDADGAAASSGGQQPVLTEAQVTRTVPLDEEHSLLPNDPGDPEIEEQLSTMTFEEVLDDIDKDCRAETRALYAREGELSQLGPTDTDVPDALQTFLSEQHARAEVSQEAWCRKLREQVSSLEELLCHAPKAMLGDVVARASERDLASRNAVAQAFHQRRAGWEDRRKHNKAALRPQLSSANCRAELDALVDSEELRSREVTSAVRDTRVSLLELLESGAADFEARFRASLRVAGVLLDTMPRVQDLGWLPGDDDILPPRKGLKRLRLQQRKLQRVAAERVAAGLEPEEPAPLRLPSRRWAPIAAFGTLQVSRVLDGAADDAAAASGEAADAEGDAAEDDAAADDTAEGAGTDADDTISNDCAIATLVSTSHRSFIAARDSMHAQFSARFSEQATGIAQEYDDILNGAVQWRQNWLKMVESLKQDDQQL
eukprot:g2575.t1